MRQYGVLIVDDSSTMRAILSTTLSRNPHLRVLGEAADPLAAREAIKLHNPDVITLDIEMPKMNGLDFLERLMRLRPTPVVVVSSLTVKGADASLRAMELGAVDCVAKPLANAPNSFDDLSEAVFAAAQAQVAPRRRVIASVSRDRRSTGMEKYSSDGRIVAIGASMGGVEAIAALLSSFPENCPPTIITQHMPALFTRSFAERLDRQFSPNVCEATDGAPMVVGRVYISPGGEAHLEIVAGNPPYCRLRRGDPVSGHRPSIDVLFDSVARSMGPNAMGVVLTGMGRDGAKGLLAMRSAGAETIGQDESSSVVYGIPRVAFEAGAVAQQLPLNAITHEILRSTHRKEARAICR